MADNRATPSSQGGRTYLESPRPIFRPASRAPRASVPPTQWNEADSTARSPPPAGIQEGRRSVQFRMPLYVPEGGPYLVQPSRALPADDDLQGPSVIPNLPTVRVEQLLTDEQRSLYVEPALRRHKYGGATPRADPDLASVAELLSRLPADLRPAAEKRFFEQSEADNRARQSAPPAVRLEELETLRRAHLEAADAITIRNDKDGGSIYNSREGLQALPSPDQHIDRIREGRRALPLPNQRYQALGGKTEVEFVDDLIQRRHKIEPDKAAEDARSKQNVPALPHPPPQSRERGRKAADTTFGHSNTCPPPPSSGAGIRPWQPQDTHPRSIRPESSITTKAQSTTTAGTSLAVMRSDSDVVAAQPKPVKAMATSDVPRQPRQPDAAKPAPQHDYLYDIDRAHASKRFCFCCG